MIHTQSNFGDANCKDTLGYTHTLMYGKYTKNLGDFAKDEARRLRLLEKYRRNEDKIRNKDFSWGKNRNMPQALMWFWEHSLARLGEDWVFLALLGISMAFLSYIMDKGVTICTNARLWLYRDLTSHFITQYFAWTFLPLCLILFSAGFVHLIAPQSIGSGIPEMKTVLRGVSLKEYLTIDTLFAKVIGLTATLGSGMPLGKEGPFVHIASIVSQLLSKLVTSFKGIYENESRNSEMLAAACAVGVGACFAAPVGGVLFSIEVTTTYFAVRNYWRGFFAAVCGATVFRLTAVWFQDADTVLAFFLTSFTAEFPFDPQELFIFALIGVVCGVGGAAYVWTHRKYVVYMRSNKRINTFLAHSKFLYPGIVAFFISTLTFPRGIGMFVAGELSTHEQVTQLFSNFTWSSMEQTVEQAAVTTHWNTKYTNVFGNLICYIAFNFCFSIIGSTMPVPSGIFIPVFKIGAGLGRLIGETMHLWFPNGIRYGGQISLILPGGYAVVGASAFSGAVTHTISVAVIVFEITGQVTHVVPVMIAVLISNAVAALLQSSIYDSIIIIKKLPYLPDLLPSNSIMYGICAEDFMVREVKYIWQKISYKDLESILKMNKTIKSFPLVDNPRNMILLGSVQRCELIKVLKQQIGREKRMRVTQNRRAEEKRLLELDAKRIGSEPILRKGSRFEVSAAIDIFNVTDISTASKNNKYNIIDNEVHPKKSILKKTNSLSLKSIPPIPSAPHTPYLTITGSDFRIKSAFEAIFKKTATLQDITPNASIVNFAELHDVNLPGVSKKVQLPKERVIDLAPEDQKRWEVHEMSKLVDFELSEIHIDPSPFQLVEKTSILKVHSLFSMIGVNHAYVTKIGRLIGVVGLKELRNAIENINNKSFALQSKREVQTEQTTDKA